jgi:hypothetical protein
MFVAMLGESDESADDMISHKFLLTKNVEKQRQPSGEQITEK